ncbi:MAG: methyl-accepting chemotaxis protein, partial [Bryobacterales bacterium]|nr:methyl-accepting chemotaxis protein [Bryobacterales bacterium]
AQRCAQAAKNTAVLIEDSMDKADEGKLGVDVVTVAVGKVRQQIVEVKRLVEKVSDGSSEQKKGIELITGSIGQMESN